MSLANSLLVGLWIPVEGNAKETIEYRDDHTVRMALFGGMISPILKCSLQETKQMLSRCRLFTLAESLGGVESLIEHRASIEGPGTTSPEGLLRLSIGLENADDLIEDLDQALR